MRFGPIIVLASVLALAAPSLASAAFVDASAAAKAQVFSLSQQQLESLNTKGFTDAHLAGKIIGFDRNEIDQLKADIQSLRNENAQLRTQGQSNGTTPSSTLEGRVAALEMSFSSLQATLGAVVTMLKALLIRL